MLRYAISMASLGGRFTAELADAFCRIHPTDGAPWALEVLPARWLNGYDADGEQRLRGLLAKGVIRVASIHLPFGGEWDISVNDEAGRVSAVRRNCAVLERWRDLGATHATLHASAEPIADGERALRMGQATRSLTELAVTAQRCGMRLGVEFLPRSCLGNKEDELLRLVAPYTNAEVGILLDVNHAMDRGSQLPAIVETLAARLITCHLSDYDNVDERHWLPGQGMIPWPSVLAAVDRVPHEVTMILETSLVASTGNPVASLGYALQSLAFLQSGGVAATLLAGGRVAMGSL